MEALIQSIRKQLKEHADEKTKESSRRFFKESINAYGVKIPSVNEIGSQTFKKVKGMPKEEIFEMCELFWKSGYIEEGFVACRWTYSLKKQFEPTDFPRFRRWIGNYITNWATCDTFCNHTMGEFLMMYPEFLNEMKLLTQSENRWDRRSSAVSLIIPARKGLFLETIFEIADKLLTDSDDLVQKGYGWMLKVTSQVYLQEVYGYVLENKKQMPRTALRYAIEKMPENLRQHAMEK